MSAESKFYVPVQTVEVSGHGHANIEGSQIEINAAPFLPNKLDGLSVVALGTSPQTEGSVNLRRISDIHGRSYEYFGGQKIVWADEFGNIYTALNSKGNNLSDPVVGVDEMNALGFNFHGLQTSVGILRQIKASQILREKGIPTEAITHVIEPLQLPFEGEDMSIEEFKLRVGEKSYIDNIEPARKTEMIHDLANVALFITVRATQVNERLMDFVIMPDEEKREALKNAFYYTNIFERAKRAKDPEHTPTIFDIDDPESVQNYLNNYLPVRIGENYARLHSAGLVHRFPTLSNISLAGSIVDLDSIEGEPLGDEPIETDYITDLDLIKGELTRMQILYSRQIDTNKFLNSFIQSYINTAMQHTEHIDIFYRNIKSFMDKDYFRDTSGNTDYLLVSSANIEAGQTADEFLQRMLESVPLPTLDVANITQIVADLKLYDDNGTELPHSARFSVLKNVFRNLIETGYDPTLRRKHKRSTLHNKIREIFDMPIVPDDSGDIYEEVLEQKTRQLIDDNSEVVQSILGSSVDEEDPSTRYDQAYISSMHEVIQYLGWDMDIVNHAYDIEDLLGLSFTRISKNDIRIGILDEMVEKMNQQTGITLPWLEDTYALISEFHEQDQAKAEEFQHFIETEGFIDSEGNVQRPVESGRYNDLYRQFTNFPEDRYTTFIVEKVMNWLEMINMRQVLFQACQNAGSADCIYDWFFAQTTHQHVDSLSKEELEAIHNASKERMAIFSFQKKIKQKSSLDIRPDTT